VIDGHKRRARFDQPASQRVERPSDVHCFDRSGWLAIEVEGLCTRRRPVRTPCADGHHRCEALPFGDAAVIHLFEQCPPIVEDDSVNVECGVKATAGSLPR
jgi:hypothetical protein